MIAKRFRAYGRDGRVVAEGNLNAKGGASLNAGATKLARVVFYGGEPDAEFVVGAMPIGGTGKVNVTFVPAKD